VNESYAMEMWSPKNKSAASSIVGQWCTIIHMSDLQTVIAIEVSLDLVIGVLISVKIVML